MTNKTVTMSRDLAQKIDDLLYIMTGHDSYPRLIHKYGKELWTPINEMRAEICTLLAAPVVEHQEPIGIEGMPQYLILFDDTERPVETMFGEEIARKRYADISMSWNAHLFVKIDSNSRDAMFAKNNATVVTSPPAPVAVVPDGWKLVPVEPTELMIRRGDQNYSWSVSKIYKAMIEDAPACLDKVKELNR